MELEDKLIKMMLHQEENCTLLEGRAERQGTITDTSFAAGFREALSSVHSEIYNILEE